MAKQVEGISEKVELCAKKEFLEKGYVDASLRTIAAEAGTTTRNDLFPIWWKRRTFFSNRRTGGKRVYRDIYRSSGKISCDRIGSAGSESGCYAEDGMKQLVKYMYVIWKNFRSW